MKFECQASCKGKCCSQWELGNFVFLTKLDRENLLKAGKGEGFLQKAEFDSTRFAKHKTWQWILKIPEETCPFLKNGKCSIYDYRPTQCRTFPYWPELLNRGEPVEDSKKACPGIGKGDKESRLESLKWLMMQLKADEELSRQKIE